MSGPSPCILPPVSFLGPGKEGGRKQGDIQKYCCGETGVVAGKVGRKSRVAHYPDRETVTMPVLFSFLFLLLFFIPKFSVRRIDKLKQIYLLWNQSSGSGRLKLKLLFE